MAQNHSGLPFWGESPELWDTVAIGGVEIPGLCRISGTGARVRSDKKRAAGRDGANVAMLGLDIVAFSIEVRMWREEHLMAFQDIIAMAKPKKRPIRKVESKEVETRGFEYSGDNPLLIRLSEESVNHHTEITSRVVGYDLVPLEVSHPALELFGITQCTIQSIAIPVEQTPGLWVSTIQCDEFNKSKLREVTRATGGKNRSGGKRNGVNILDGVTAADMSPAKTNTGLNGA